MIYSKNASMYFDGTIAKSRKNFMKQLTRKLNLAEPDRPLVFLCIGSDRATGDCLGPLVGQSLLQYTDKQGSAHSFGSFFLNAHPEDPCRQKKAVVYGSLQHTVHAGNLDTILNHIQNCYFHPYVVAIDASLGVPEHVGFVTLGDGCLHPGIGVDRYLPEAGDIHITGIVNRSSRQNALSLQTTNLSTVMQLSAFIADGICETLHVRPSLQRPQKRHFINIF